QLDAAQRAWLDHVSGRATAAPSGCGLCFRALTSSGDIPAPRRWRIASVISATNAWPAASVIRPKTQPGRPAAHIETAHPGADADPVQRLGGYLLPQPGLPAQALVLLGGSGQHVAVIGKVW